MSDPIVARGPATAVPPGHAETVPTYSPDDMLDLVLAAYERGYTAGLIEGGRRTWNTPEVADRFRRARQQAEAADMKERASRNYTRHGYPDGYDYRGGAVNWETGLPQGSGCAWLRIHRRYELAGGQP